MKMHMTAQTNNCAILRFEGLQGSNFVELVQQFSTLFLLKEWHFFVFLFFSLRMAYVDGNVLVKETVI